MRQASKETIIWRLQVQSWLQASNNTGILNTCTQLWLTESEQANPVDSIKDVVWSSVKASEVDKLLKKAGGHKRCGNNNKDEDNSPKTLNDKNHQASSQKFRELKLTLLFFLSDTFIKKMESRLA